MGKITQIDSDEAREILKFYHLGELDSLKATVTGISNSNYQAVLKNGEKVLIKISNDKTYEQLQNEQIILTALKNHAYPYSLHPYETIKGGPIYRHDGMFGVIFPFIDGLPPQMNESVLTAHSCHEIGKALGALHSIEIDTSDLDKIRPHDLVGFGGTHIFDYTLQMNAPSDFVAAFNKIFPDKLQQIPYDVFPVGIIHGDLYFDNALFKNDKLVTLIDFEQAGRGRFILDIGIALSGCCIDRSNDEFQSALMDSFLAGYESSRHLLKIERQYLKTAILVGFFSIALWRIKRFYEGHLDDSKRDNYKELLKRAYLFNQTYQSML